MKEMLKKSENLFVIYHFIFIIITLIILLIPFQIEIGIKLFILVIIYNLSVALLGFPALDKVWSRIWLYSFLISIFQVFPDWFLSAELNILVFPSDGLFNIGTVSGYMFGLWTIPLFIIIYGGMKCKEKFTDLKAILIVLTLSLLIFGTSEATIWIIGSWYPQNVTTLFGHLAIYILPAELILGVSSYYTFTRIKNKSLLYYFPLSFAIMLLYFGSSSFFYFLIEKIML